jgi:hypothetical protein
MGVWSLFKKKNKKKDKMEINEQTINDARAYHGAFDYQWIKGDDMSMVERYKNISLVGEQAFIDFESGKRINAEILNEFMIMLPAQPKITQSAAPAQMPQISQQPNASAVTSIVYEDQKNSNSDSPIYKLLKKQKKNLVEVSIKIKLNLPPKDLYTVLSGSFEDAEREIIDFVLDGVDIENIKASLADSIKKTYYNEKIEKAKAPSQPAVKKEVALKQESDDE